MKHILSLITITFASQLVLAASPVNGAQTLTPQPCEQQAQRLVAELAKLNFGASITKIFAPHVVEQELLATYGNGNTKDWRYLIDMQDKNGASLAASHGGEGSIYEVKLESSVQAAPVAPSCQIRSIIFKPLD